MADISQLSDADLNALIAQAQGQQAGQDTPIQAIKQIESSGAPDTSTITNPSSGATGSMQVTPNGAGSKNPGFGVKPSNGTPEDNARVGRDYYSALQNKYQDPTTAAIAYNWGPGNTDKWLKNGADLSKLPSETLDYAIKFQQLTGSGQQQQNAQSDLGYTPMAQFNQTVPQSTPNAFVLGNNATQGTNWKQSLSDAVSSPLQAIKSAAGGIGQGFGNTVLGAEGLAGRGLSAIGLDTAGQALQSDSAQGIQNLKQQAAALPNQGAVKVGNVVGEAAPAVAGGASLLPQVAINAGLGAANAQASGSDIGTGALLGGAGGAAGVGASKLLGGLVGGVGGQDVQALRNIGVAPTLGQTLGGVANAFEQRATSIPLFGDAIAAGRQGAANQFNKGVTNQALAPIGADVGSAAAGSESIAAATKALGDAYDQVLPNATFKFDQPFATQVGAARQLLAATGAPQDILNRFDDTVTNQLLNRTTNGVASGDVFKAGEGNLTKTIKGLAGDSDADKRALGQSLGQVLSAARDSLTRNSAPEVGQQLQAINQAYAKFKTVEAAAGSKAGGQIDGIFTPAAYLRSVKSGATQGQRARGQAFGQPLAEAAVRRLGSSVPDSGTAGRLAQGAGIGALGATAVANPLAALGITTGAGLTHLAYSDAGRRLLSAALSARPELLQQIGGQIGNTGNITGGLLGSAINNGNQ